MQTLQSGEPDMRVGPLSRSRPRRTKGRSARAVPRLRRKAAPSVEGKKRGDPPGGMYAVEWDVSAVGCFHTGIGSRESAASVEAPNSTNIPLHRIHASRRITSFFPFH